MYELYEPYDSLEEAQADIKTGLFDSFWTVPPIRKTTPHDSAYRKLYNPHRF